MAAAGCVLGGDRFLMLNTRVCLWAAMLPKFVMMCFAKTFLFWILTTEKVGEIHSCRSKRDPPTEHSIDPAEGLTVGRQLIVANWVAKGSLAQPAQVHPPRMGRILRKPLATCHGHSERRSEEHTSELQSLRHLVCRL